MECLDSGQVIDLYSYMVRTVRRERRSRQESLLLIWQLVVDPDRVLARISKMGAQIWQNFVKFCGIQIFKGNHNILRL